MSICKLLIKYLILGTILLAGAAEADNQEICVPFKHSAVDQAIVASLISAAEQGELYRIQPQASKLAFGVNSVVGRIEVEFTDFQGGISLHAPDQTKQGPALVRIGTDSLETSGFIMEQFLKGEDFFDVTNFPEVFFASKELHLITLGWGVLSGELTLRNTTRPVTFNIDLLHNHQLHQEDMEKIHLKATTTIHRSDFGMNAFSGLAENDVDLSIEVIAIRIPSPLEGRLVSK